MLALIGEVLLPDYRPGVTDSLGARSVVFEIERLSLLILLWVCFLLK